MSTLKEREMHMTESGLHYLPGKPSSPDLHFFLTRDGSKYFSVEKAVPFEQALRMAEKELLHKEAVNA